MEKVKFKFSPIIISVLIQIFVTLLFIALFSFGMNLAEIDYKYSPVFASVATAFGGFCSAMYMSAQKGSRGYLIGLSIGGITFAIVTLIGLMVNNGSVTINTLFHLIIIILSSVTGGILGVNKKGKKYL